MVRTRSTGRVVSTDEATPSMDSSAVSFGNRRRKTRRGPCDDNNCTSSLHQRVTRSRSQALAQNDNDVFPFHSSIPEATSHLTTSADGLACNKQAAVEQAPINEDQQVEPSDKHTSEMEKVHFLPEPSQPSQPVEVMMCERAGAGAVPEKQKVISLLDCSDDDEESDEEDQEKMEVSEVKRGKSTVVPAASVDGLFMIDMRPGSDVDDQYYKKGQEGEEAGTSKGDEEEEFVDEEGGDEDEEALTLFSRSDSHVKELSSSIDPGINLKDLGGLCVTFDGSSSKPSLSSSRKLKEKKIHDKGFSSLASESTGESTGQAWFNMKSPELTQELKRDGLVLKMRGALDSKRFYKKNDRESFPKFFQMATVVDNPVDFHSRIPKKKRKSTMVEELLADAEFRQDNKKKYQNIVLERAASLKKKKTTNV